MRKKMWKKFLPITMAVVIFATSMPMDALANTVSQNTVTQEEQTQSPMPMAEVVDANTDGTTGDLLDGTTITLNDVTLKATYKEEGSSTTTIVNITDGGEFELPYNADINMRLNFTLADGNAIEAGKSYVYKLPDSIRVDVEADHELEDGTGKSIGKVRISQDGTLTFQYYADVLANNTNVDFYVQFEGGLSEDLQESGKEVDVTFPTASGDFDFTINTTDSTENTEDPEPKDISIQKSGAQIMEDGNGRKYIEWTIELGPEGRDTIDGTIVDVLPEGLTYVPGSAVLVDNIEGQGSINATINGQNLQIEVNDVKTYYHAKVKFKTYYDEEGYGYTIDNSTYDEVKNEAIFNPSDGTNGVTDDGTVRLVPDVVSKSGSAVDANGDITWTVVLNREQLDIQGTTYTDTFGAGMELNGNVSISPAGATISTTSTGFTVDFPTGSAMENTYTITYKTKVTDWTMQSYKNTGVLTGGVNPHSFNYSKEAVVPGLNLLDKAYTSFNTVTNTFTWTITVNAEGKQLQNVSVIDSFDPSTMEFISASVAHSDLDEANGKVTFDLGDISVPQTITIVTRIKDPESWDKTTYYQFVNNVELTSDDIATTITDRAETWTQVKEPELISKKGEIKDGVIEWTVTVNQPQLTVEGIVLSDVLPEKTSYIPGTFRIQNLWYDENPIYVEPTVAANGERQETISYTMQPNDPAQAEFMQKSFWFVYQTKVTDVDMASESNTYTNDAKLSVTYEDDVLVEDEAGSTVTGVVGGVVDKTYSYKSGDQTVTWDIAINQGRNDMSTITNPKISDQLADYFDYVSGTLYLVDAQGNETAVAASDYIVSTVNNKIIVQLPKDADNKYLGTNCYIFRFTTRFNVLAAELEGKKITNTASFVGTGESFETESDVVNNVSFSSSSAGAVVKREVRVRKVDATTGAPLANAKFELYLGDECIGEAVSDANGDAVFEDMNSVIGYTIKLKEVQAPDGYVLDPTEREIVFTEENLRTQSGVDYYEVEIPNTAEAVAVTGEINIRKEDANGNLLNGAVFGLYSEDSTLIKSRTATDGTLTFTDLAEGTYYVKEISSPAGYKVSDEVITAVIANDVGSAVVTYTSSTRGNLGQASVVSITNEKATGSLKITKQDKESATPLDGATFSIYKDANCTDRVATAITSSGVLTFSGLELGRTYYYRETVAPTGYVLDTTIYQITIGDGTEVTDQVEEVVIKNTEERGNIVIYKIDDSATPVRLSGVEFALYQSDGTTPVLDSSSNPYVVTTDDEGKAAFSNIPFGDYIVKETATAEGYRITAADTAVTIKQLGDTEITVINEKIVVDIKIVKEDGNDHSLLSGAEFGLYKSNGVQVAKGTTGDDGTLVFHDIPYGNYYIQELKAPAGYNIAGDGRINIAMDKFTASETILAGNVIAYVIENTKQNGSIEITKVDDQSNSLAGAEFTLYDENMIRVNVAGVTNPVMSVDVTGIATFTGLPYGTYYVQETASPVGYVRDPNVYKVIVTNDTPVNAYTKENGNTEPLTIVNIVADAPHISFKLKKVDSETGLPLANATFELYKNGVPCNPAVTAVTGANGIAYFRKVEVKNDGPDTIYSVHEIAAPTGYKLDAYSYTLGDREDVNQYGDPLLENGDDLTDDQIRFIGGSVVESTTSTVENDPLKGSVKVTKTSQISTTLLVGAEFTLYDENRNIVSIAGLTNPATTDANGVVTFTNLPVGIYYLKETKAPKGYTLNTTETRIVVTDETVHEVTYKDTPINVSISKKAVGGDAEIVGAVFKIYKQNDANKTAVDSWTTTGNIHRVLVGALEVGETYVLTEMIAPDGYGYMADQQFKVNEDGSITVLTGELEKTGQTLVVRDKQVKLAISKIDKDTAASLAGAILGIYDENGVEVDRFTSTTTTYDVPLGKLIAPAFNTDGSVAYKQYTLKEISAPDGYQLADDIVFAVDSYGKVYTAQVTESVTNYTEITGNNPTITMEDEEKPSGTIYIRKLNAKTSLDIKGATLGIYDINGTLIKEINPSGTPVAMTCGSGSGFDLEFDTDYILKETTVPAGYLQAKDIPFKVVVDVNGKAQIVLGNGATADNLNGDKDTIMMRDQELELKIRKQDSFGQVLNGAVLTVSEYDMASGTVGTEIIEFTSGGGVAQNILSKDLKVGQSYVLHEVSAPDGYHKAADIVFTIQADGSLVRADGVQVYNNTIVMEDDEAGLSIGKISLNTGRGLAGSTLELTSQDDPYFTTQTWVSDGTNRTWELTEFTPGCTYTLTELKAPLGYALTDPIVFTIDATDHQIYINGELAANRTVHIADGKLELAVNKLDFYSKENVKGAKLGVYDTNGNLITSWTSGVGKIWIDTSKMVVQADDYQEYILREIEAPAGYKKADDIHFAFDRDGKVYLVTEDPILGTKQYDEVDDKTLVMYDVPYIRVEKVDTDGNPVVGAKLQITAKDDASFTPVTWTTDGKPYWFADNTFKEGVTYVLTELEAPAGYVVAEPVEFTVDADNNLYVKGQKVLNRRIVMIDQKAATGGGAPGSSSPIIGNVNTTLPKTGDGTPLGTLMLFMAFGLFGACMTFGGYLRRKYRKSE